ncbi:non-heme iron oxygenase ferredoxin subunit [Pseudomaricurvus alkylphenolicus]|uniref:non-heme iron oxygenase ferredoxin subunit n=1 Tax=Pseudomaricurvus alkylphenolicus TaxID=1306991 RepID=UPI00197F9AEB|nr:non-heme iron oxygenase ferredoxin subunit [Pseudomaricurvus alkylphenolicus]
MRNIALIKSGDLEPGEVTKVEVDGLPAIAVYNLDGEFFATDDLCTHGDASMAEGFIDDNDIVCPFHGGTFDIRTGEANGSPCLHNLKAYRVLVEDGIVMIRLDE